MLCALLNKTFCCLPELVAASPVVWVLTHGVIFGIDSCGHSKASIGCVIFQIIIIIIIIITIIIVIIFIILLI